MKYFVKTILAISITFYFSGCALEEAPVIGPAKGYVFFDKGVYSDGWRYLECAPKDIEFNFKMEKYNTDIEKAKTFVSNFYHGGYNGWRIPNDWELNMMTKVLAKKTNNGYSKYYLSSEKTVYYWYGDSKWEKREATDTSSDSVYTIWAVREF
jgi:hypothetical protein